MITASALRFCGVISVNKALNRSLKCAVVGLSVNCQVISCQGFRDEAYQTKCAFVSKAMPEVLHPYVLSTLD